MQQQQKPVAAVGGPYTPLPLVFPPIDPFPESSGSSEALQDQGLEGHVAAVASLAGLRQHLFQRMHQVAALHQHIAESQQPLAYQRPLEELLESSTSITDEKSAGAQPPLLARTEPVTAGAAHIHFPERLRCHPADFADIGASCCAPVSSMYGSPAPAFVDPLTGAPSEFLAGGTSWMQRHAEAIMMAAVYEGQLRLWHSFASQLQLRLLVATQRATVAKLVSNTDSSRMASFWPPSGPGLLGSTTGASLLESDVAAPARESGGSSRDDNACQQKQQLYSGATTGSSIPSGITESSGSADASTVPSVAAAASQQQQQPQQQAQQQQQQRPQQQAPWRLRFMVMYLKLLVLLFLFDAGKWVYVCCLVVALLHTNGAFNPIIDLITSTSHRQPFEATMAQLRGRRERRPLQRLRLRQQRLHASVGRPFEGEAPVPADITPDQPSGVAAASSSSSANSSSGDSSAVHGSSSSGDSSSNSSNSNRAWVSSVDEDSQGLRARGQSNETPTLVLDEGPPGIHSAAEGQNVSQASRREAASIPPYWKRALYQGVAMFFLTTIPSWNPNPDLLIDYEGLAEEEEGDAVETERTSPASVSATSAAEPEGVPLQHNSGHAFGLPTCIHRFGMYSELGKCTCVCNFECICRSSANFDSLAQACVIGDVYAGTGRRRSVRIAVHTNETCPCTGIGILQISGTLRKR
ncbi:uncharacterized protein LOC34620779 [Cyclospora cayetanensis]|uniref:Uncharacterized protein LOC34620779 n=1 Tax=Cyclospora cayetanensis TaxID=88456 RepID=A0A6P6RVW2_9EIME|nr:uncharacterized protein LOC34620779 [Cyclospora cayetanensis]